MDNETRKELRDYAWKYFDRHAEQRLKAFNFYILLCGAVLAGIAATLRDSSGSMWLASLLAAVLGVVSFIFWKLDSRTRDLVKHSEEALKIVEDHMGLPVSPTGEPHRCNVFRWEDYDAKGRPLGYFTYTRCFGVIFVLFGWGGAFLSLILALTAISQTNPPPSAVTSGESSLGRNEPEAPASLSRSMSHHHDPIAL